MRWSVYGESLVLRLVSRVLLVLLVLLVQQVLVLVRTT